MVLNGINYTEKHLTDEEMAVVEAMRMGAKVQTNFFFSTEQAAAAHLDKLSLYTFDKLDSYEIDGGYEVRRFESNRVEIVHFIQQQKNRP